MRVFRDETTEAVMFGTAVAILIGLPSRRFLNPGLCNRSERGGARR